MSDFRNEIDIDPMEDGTVRCTLSGDIAKAIIEKFAAYQKLLEEVKQLRAKVCGISDSLPHPPRTG